MNCHLDQANSHSLSTNWELSAEVNITNANSSAPLIIKGSEFSSWGLFIKSGKPELIYKTTHIDEDMAILKSDQPLGLGKHNINFKIMKVANNQHKLTLYVDNVAVAEKIIVKPAFSGGDTYIGRQGSVPFDKDVSTNADGILEKVDIKMAINK